MKNTSEQIPLAGRLRFFALWLASQRWLRFGIVGLLATLTYFLLGLFFVNFLPLPLLVDNALAYVISFFVSYAGQSLWTFRAHGSHAAMLGKFAVAQGIGLAINTAIVGLLNKLGLAYWICMAAAIVIVPVFVYLICKYWVFRAKEPKNA